MKPLQKWKKPKKFDCNLVVIGAGSAGLVSAYIASAVKAKVILVEKHKMGGDCLNTGCVPSKALIRTAKLIAQMNRSGDYGIKRANAEFSFAEVMERVQSVIKTIEPHDSVERYTRLGVDVVIGDAKLVTPWSVRVTTAEGTQCLTAKAIIIAAGAKPFIPPIPGIHEIVPLTSDTVWELRELPNRLLVLGGGPIGCELAQCFARLGSRVTQVEMAPRLLSREDTDVSETILERFVAEGIDVRLAHLGKAFVTENGEKLLIAEHRNQTVKIPFDQVLCAIGRSANISGYGLEELGIALTERKTIAADPFQATNYSNIYAVGDVTGPFQFTHTAAHQAWYAAINALFSPFTRFKTDYSVIPWSTFIDPEVARAGLNEQEADAQKIPYDSVKYDIADLDRAIADGDAHGFVKVLTKPGKDTIIGVTIVGEHAGDLLAEFVLAMKYGLGLNKILSAIHIYPTLAEANKYVAGEWRRRHAPAYLYPVLERFHAWRRGE